ncbi:DNA internalization-related competence protein ComEC/Rec2 [Ralstonia wenshanensis]|uniref:DNA internalization-related competence protein ComEC/Rec2 n=1 Tax=Ralstonia wenshanensis TaxID=2842456 RepID=UPI001E3F77CB|nr:DNA internalization-related competence protein ComEC/Rec2 [Ralstonia wenshanensis]UGS91968.1 DNA internalization-related competence protein ComEC/Rec2 [Ralstonia wenshanensis]
MRLGLIGFVAGCVALQMQAAPPPVWQPLCVLVLCLSLAAVMRRRPALFPVLLVASTVAAGFGWSDWRAQQRMAVALSPAWEGKDIIATGVVAELPQTGDEATRFLFHIESSNAGDAVPPRVRLSWYGTQNWGNVGEEGAKPDRRAGIPDLQPGQRWQLTLRVKRPHSLTNPGGFDGEYAMLADNIRAVGYVRTGKRAQNIALDETGTGFGIGVERWRASVRRHILAALPDARYAAVMVALVVGDQSGIARDDWGLFRRTGISHLVSISGLHITMIAGLFAALWMALWRRSFGLARWLRTPLPLRMPTPRAGAVAAMLGAFGYCLLAGMGVPAQRTLLMLSTVAIARLTDRNVPASLSLCWAAAVVAMVDPWAVMSAGFWLSFGAVAIIFFAAQMALDARRNGKTDGWIERTQRALAGGTRIQLAVTFGLLPLTLLLFQQTSVVSAVANGLAIPAVSFVTTPLALIGAALPDPLAQPVLMLAEASFRWLAVWLEWLAQPRWAVWVAPAAPKWALLLSLLGVALLLVPGGVRAWAWRAQGALLLLPLVLARVPMPLPGEFRLVAFDIGQGAAALVETANHRLLFDTGPRYGDHADAAARVIAPYLRSHGVESLDTLVVSHEDSDHAGGTETVIGAVPVRTMLASLPPGHALRGVADESGVRFADCLAGQTWTWDGVVFEVLHPLRLPAESERVSSNARSCVLRIANGRHAALLTGDIEAAQESALIAAETPERLMADILLVPHHGSKTSSSGAFLDAVSPQVAVFQVGYRNRYGHPHQQVWRRYVARDIDSLRTDKTGAVVIETGGDVLNVQTARTMRPRYWSSAQEVEPLATAAGAVDAQP